MTEKYISLSDVREYIKELLIMEKDANQQEKVLKDTFDWDFKKIGWTPGEALMKLCETISEDRDIAEKVSKVIPSELDERDIPGIVDEISNLLS